MMEIVLQQHQQQTANAAVTEQGKSYDEVICDNSTYNSNNRKRCSTRSSIGTTSTAVSTLITSDSSGEEEEYELNDLIDDMIEHDNHEGGMKQGRRLHTRSDDYNNNTEIDGKNRTLPPPSIMIHSMNESSGIRRSRTIQSKRKNLGDELSFSLQSLDYDELYVLDEEEDTVDVTCDEQKQVVNLETVNTDERQEALPEKHVVQFSTVTIRDYARAMSDNPASSTGPSISIGWVYESENTYNVDEYESSRCGNRRYGREMLVPCSVREDILRHAGYSRAEIVKCIRDLNITRHQRRQTYATLHLHGFHVVAESLSRKVLNVLSLGEYKRKKRLSEQELLQRNTTDIITSIASKKKYHTKSPSNVSLSSTTNASSNADNETELEQQLEA